MDTLNEDVRSLWSEMELQKAAFLNQLDAWSESQRAYRLNDGWNALQIIEHLMTSEAGTLQYLMKKTQSGASALEPRTEREAASGKQLTAALKSTQKFQAPEVLHPPKGELDYEELKNNWRTLRRQWSEVLSSLSPEFQDRLVFRHPIAGMLDLEQTLSFIGAHIAHHRHQLERIERTFNA